MNKQGFTKVSIESADGGWAVAEKGVPTKVFVRWDALIRHLESRLTSKGEKEAPHEP